MGYVTIIVKTDLYTRLYEEVINEITRDDDSIVANAIDNAIAEAKMYLSQFELIALFGSVENDTAATFTDKALSNLLKDIAAWQLVSLCNVAVNYEAIRSRYKDAIATLTKIQSGQVNPMWPYRNPENDTAPDPLNITIQSNPLRNNYY
jgi:phage gp36-like protein